MSHEETPKILSTTRKTDWGAPYIDIGPWPHPRPLPIDVAVIKYMPLTQKCTQLFTKLQGRRHFPFWLTLNLS